MFDSNHFIRDTSPLFISHGIYCACSLSANSSTIGCFSDCPDRLATARERTTSQLKIMPTLNDYELLQVTQHKVIGMVVDDNLQWRELVNGVVKKVSQILALFSRIKHC